MRVLWVRALLDRLLDPRLGLREGVVLHVFCYGFVIANALPMLFLSYPILFNPILSYPVLSYPLLTYPILTYPNLSNPILSYPILTYILTYPTLS